MPAKMNYESFVANGRKKHGDKYEYPGEFIDINTETEILCRTHGIFKQKPYNHFRSGCPQCAGNVKKSFEDFQKEVLEYHKGKITVSEENYKGLQKDIVFTCELHGEQKINHAYNLLRGIGCPVCVRESMVRSLTKSHIKFVEEARAVHGDLYEYHNVYEGSHNHLKITCKKHGEFLQISQNHLNGQGCPKCSSERLSVLLKNDIEDMKNRMNETHYGKYDYSNFVEYYNNRQKIDIICPKHGVFSQQVTAHINGQGCPKCANKITKPVSEIQRYLEALGCSVLLNDRTILKQWNLELDIVIEDKKIAIEYHGLFFHKEGLIEGLSTGKNKDYHLNKTKYANQVGYKLIQIFEDEWLNNKELCLSKISHALGVSKGTIISARKCKISKVDSKPSNEFLKTYHIQGGDKSAVRYGAFYGDDLVAVMTFLSFDEGYYLNRFATNTDYRINGIASRLLKKFIIEYNPRKIVTFADRRWTLDGNDNLYVKLGFSLEEIQPPVYHYVSNEDNFTVRQNRQHFMKHKILKNNPGLDASKTEKELMIELGYDRVWDCGNYKYVKTL